MNKDQPKCFISYSSLDRPIAAKLEKKLTERGLNVWIDNLQILPGDSLIQKIFEEGLKDCQVFVVLISSNSVKSEWVKQELDVALINKIKRITRVIPVIINECEIPVALRSILWINLQDGLERASDLIANAAYSKKPEKVFHEPPEFIQKAVAPRSGLSQESATVGAFIASNVNTTQYPSPSIDGNQIEKGTKLLAELINDAVDELSAYGLVRIYKFLGTKPYNFGILEPTYALVYMFSEYIQGEINPKLDVRQVATVVASLNEVDGNTISEKLHFEANRINFAVDYLRDYGIIKTIDYMGTAPYTFGRALATRNTRQFVKEP